MSVIVFEENRNEEFSLLRDNLCDCFYVYDGAREYIDKTVLCFKNSLDAYKHIHVVLGDENFTVWYMNENDSNTDRRIQNMQKYAWRDAFDREYRVLSRGIIDCDADLEVLLEDKKLFSDGILSDLDSSYKISKALRYNNYEQYAIGSGKSGENNVIVCGFKNYDSNDLLKSCLYMTFYMSAGNVKYNSKVSLYPLRKIVMEDGNEIELEPLDKASVGINSYYVIPDKRHLIPYSCNTFEYISWFLRKLNYDALLEGFRFLAMEGFVFRRQVVFWGNDVSMVTINKELLSWPSDKRIAYRYPIETIAIEFVNPQTGEAAYMELNSDYIEICQDISPLLEKLHMSINDMYLEKTDIERDFYNTLGTPEAIMEGLLITPFYVFEKEMRTYGLIGKYSILMDLFCNKELLKYYSYLGELVIDKEEDINKAMQILTDAGFEYVGKLETMLPSIDVYANRDRSCAVYVIDLCGDEIIFDYADEFMQVEYMLDNMLVNRKINKGFMEKTKYN